MEGRVEWLLGQPEPGPDSNPAGQQPWQQPDGMYQVCTYVLETIVMGQVEAAYLREVGAEGGGGWRAFKAAFPEALYADLATRVPGSAELLALRPT